MSRPLRARFESAETVLREAAAADSVDNLVQLAKLQSNAILDQLRQEKLSAEDAAELSVVAQRLCLREPYKRLVLAALGNSVKGPHQGRRALQDYTKGIGFFDEVQWTKLRDEKTNPYAVRDVLVRQLISLGGVNLQEPTFKLFTSLWLLLSDGRVKALLEMPASEKCKRRDEFKKEHLRQKTRLKKDRLDELARHYFHELPDTPAELKASHPEFYESVFSAGEPVPIPPIDMVALRDIDASFGCRGDGGAELLPIARSASSTLAVRDSNPSASSSLAGADLHGVMGLLFEGMTKFGEQQQRMMQAMWEGRENSRDAAGLRLDISPSALANQARPGGGASGNGSILRRLNTIEEGPLSEAVARRSEHAGSRTAAILDRPPTASDTPAILDRPPPAAPPAAALAPVGAPAPVEAPAPEGAPEGMGAPVPAAAPRRPVDALAPEVAAAPVGVPPPGEPLARTALRLLGAVQEREAEKPSVDEYPRRAQQQRPRTTLTTLPAASRARPPRLQARRARAASAAPPRKRVRRGRLQRLRVRRSGGMQPLAIAPSGPGTSSCAGLAFEALASRCVSLGVVRKSIRRWSLRRKLQTSG